VGLKAVPAAPAPPMHSAGVGMLSIVVPAYNEEDNVGPLYDAIMAVAPVVAADFEVIVVDDGSNDRTFTRLATLAAADQRLRVIKLRRNYGQTPALMAGIDHARGEVIVTMDADLQNDPKDLGRLLAELEAGFDLVVGWRRERKDTWLRSLLSRLANRLIAWVTGVAVHDNGCTLKAFRAELIKSMPLYSEMHRFIPALMSIHGCRLAELVVDHHHRHSGTSKYGLSRIYKVCFDLMTIKALLVFARRPLLCFFGTTALASVAALLSCLPALYYAFLNEGDSAVIFMGVSVLLGSLAIFLGLGGMVVSIAYQHFLDPGAFSAIAGAAGNRR
jgi:glycosyltransferase involved in cell wall biosynthesis